MSATTRRIVGRRELLTGAAALAAYSTLSGAQGAIVGQRRALLFGGAPSWVLRAGGIPASVDTDLANNRAWVNGVGLVSISSLLSISRSSNETYTDANGNLSYVGSNVLAIGSAGLQAWEARINIALNSQNLSTGSWFSSPSGTGSAAVVTANSSTAPDGTLTATRVQLALNGGVTGTAISDITQNVTVSSATTYTLSGWIKSNTAASYAGMFGDAANALEAVTVTPAWQRFIYTETTAGTTYRIAALRLRGGQSPTNSDSADVSIWGVQLEVGSFASPYIPTTTVAAALAADNITATGALATALASAAQTLAFYSNGLQQSLAATIVDSNGTVLLGKTSGNALTTALGATLSTGNTGMWTSATKGHLGFDPAGGVINLNNGTSATDATARTPAATFHVGSTSGSSAFLDGNLTRLTVFGSKVSPVLP